MRHTCHTHSIRPSHLSIALQAYLVAFLELFLTPSVLASVLSAITEYAPPYPGKLYYFLSQVMLICIFPVPRHLHR